MLNTKMNNPAATSPSVSGGSGYYQNWQYTGPFKGVFAGYWGGSFGAQGASGFLWSSSTQAVDVSYAHYAYFVATSVSPGHFDDRSVGFGVRCVLD
jgi:hypothetical protein